MKRSVRERAQAIAAEHHRTPNGNAWIDLRIRVYPEDENHPRRGGFIAASGTSKHEALSKHEDIGVFTQWVADLIREKL